MKAGHTSGPWGKLGFYVVTTKKGQEVVVGAAQGQYLPPDKCEANARLMAAAPDLLAAVQRLLDEDCPFACDAQRCECGEDGDGDGGTCAHVQAHRAVAKARG